MSWYPGKIVKELLDKVKKRQTIFREYGRVIYNPRIDYDLYLLIGYARDLEKMFSSWYKAKDLSGANLAAAEEWIRYLNHYFKDLKEAVELEKKSPLR